MGHPPACNSYKVTQAMPLVLLRRLSMGLVTPAVASEILIQSSASGCVLLLDA